MKGRSADPFHLRRAGLPRRRPGTCLPEGQRAGALRTVTDAEALDALVLIQERRDHPGAWRAPTPGLRPAEAPRLSRNRLIVVNISGRGDKDMKTVAAETGVEL